MTAGQGKLTGRLGSTLGGNKPMKVHMDPLTIRGNDRRKTSHRSIQWREPSTLELRLTADLWRTFSTGTQPVDEPDLFVPTPDELAAMRAFDEYDREEGDQ